MIPRIQPEELHELAASWGLSLEPAEAEELLAVGEAVFQAYDLLESQEPALVEPVRAVRDPGRRPQEAEDR